MVFKVTEIVDGDTFKVKPNWKWNEKSGNIVRPLGFDTPEKGDEGYNEATKKLSGLILGKEVELRRPIKLTYGRLLCEVFVDNVNIVTYLG